MATKVYLLIHANLPAFKVGIADNVAARIKRIGAAINHAESYIIECATRQQAHRLEKLIHWAIEDHRCADTSALPKDGVTEWFECTALDKAIECINSTLVSGRVLRISKGIDAEIQERQTVGSGNKTWPRKLNSTADDVITKARMILNHIETLLSLGMVPRKNSIRQTEWVLAPGLALDKAASEQLISAMECMPTIDISTCQFSSKIYGSQYDYSEQEGVLTEAVVGSFDMDRLESTAEMLGIKDKLPTELFLLAGRG
jgi:hypothetical protein